VLNLDRQGPRELSSHTASDRAARPAYCSRRACCAHRPASTSGERVAATARGIGRVCPLTLVRLVIAQSEDELHHLLFALQRKELLYEQPGFPEVEYVFKHALTQEVADNSMLIERRKVLHQYAAEAIERLFHHQLEKHYAALAHHYKSSGNTEKAIQYLLKDFRAA